MSKVKNSISARSRTPEKSHEDFLLNTYMPDKDYHACAGISRDKEYPNIRNDTEVIGFDMKSTLIKLNKNSELFIPVLPEIDRLIVAHAEEHKERLLSEILDFDRIGSGVYYFQEKLNMVVNINLKELKGTCLTDEELATIESYRTGVGLLKLGRVKDGKKAIKKAAENKFSHAIFLHALTIFREIINYYLDHKSKLPGKKVMDEAIMSMIRLRWDFFPLPSFILGIMQVYSQIKIPATNFEFPNISAHACFKEILRGILCNGGSYKCFVPTKCMMVDKNVYQTHLKWIVQASKYELARHMILYSGDLSYAKAVLKELSVDGFVDAKCLYGLGLLKNVFGDISCFDKENFLQAYDNLEQAVNQGHREAMFVFGTLPFREEFQYFEKENLFSKGRHCFEYLGKYLETPGIANDLKKAAAVFIAAEYVKKRNSFVTYDEENAKYILKKHNYSFELLKLEHQLLARLKNILPDLVSALEKVCQELSKDCHSSAKHIPSLIKELLIVLKDSGLIVEETEHLALTLISLNIPSLETNIVILSLLMTFQVLEHQLNKKLHYYPEKVLALVRSLHSKIFDLHIEFCRRIVNNMRKDLNCIET